MAARRYPRFIVDWRAQEKERLRGAQQQLLSHADQLEQAAHAKLTDLNGDFPIFFIRSDG